MGQDRVEAAVAPRAAPRVSILPKIPPGAPPQITVEECCRRVLRQAVSSGASDFIAMSVTRAAASPSADKLSTVLLV
jgi:hypothetical protein